MGVLLQIDNIHKSHGTHVLLDGATLSISEGEKIGFIGRNGAGKSTLLRIIVGEEQADGGTVIKHPSLRLGYLEQHEHFLPEETVLEHLERKSHKPEWECAKVAAQFQLKKERLMMPALSLSGGYQMRVKLAAMLLTDPNLLLLDEPTNYLDLQTLLLLEQFLRGFRGAFVIVSHDREFLKNTCTHTLEIERGDLFLYPRNIEEYLAFKEEEIERKIRENRNIETQQKHLQTFITRFRAKASKATQAQSKMKQLAKLRKIEIAHPLKNVRIHIPQVEMRKSFAVRATHLAIGYPDKRVAEEVHLEIQRGDHVAVLGENGMGKSTLLKTLAGLLDPLEGTFCWGNKLRVAYYAQQVQTMLHPKETVGVYLERSAASGVTKEDLYKMAGDFLFSIEDLDKQIAVLSGGERARLCLAGILLGRFDVLILDEPTNHLDFETVEALGDALRRFRGTILFTSHSRTFVNLLATHILEVKDGTIRFYPDTYEAYVYFLQQTMDLLPRRKDGDEETDETEEGQRTKKERYALLQEKRKALKKIETLMNDYAKEKERLMQTYTEQPTVYSRERDVKLHTIETVLRHTEDEWIKAEAEIEELSRG